MWSKSANEGRSVYIHVTCVHALTISTRCILQLFLLDAIPNWKFTFDASKTEASNTGSSSQCESTITANSKIVSVPERPGNVLYVSGGTAMTPMSNVDKTHTCYL